LLLLIVTLLPQLSTLQGVKIPKWAPRSRQGVFVGFSKLHSSLIGLILNRTTGSITAQFHLVFDDSFSTVHSDEDSTKDPDLPNYFDAMSGDKSEDYREAMKGEVEVLMKRETWELVDCSSVGSTASVIPGTWTFRCKRRPDGSFQKFKA
jgi:hypothetical protein